MNLTVDIGNTIAKIAVFDNGQPLEVLREKNLTAGLLENIFYNYPDVDKAVLISTSGTDLSDLTEFIDRRTTFFLLPNADTPVPIVNNYETPRTLGFDRVAAAVGAGILYPQTNVLIVDFGTAVTFDLLTAENIFLGGNISPGLTMRFRALSDYTGKLPLLDAEGPLESMGRSTETAVRSGVVNGLLYEIQGYISDLQKEYDPLRIIFTGGDSDYFAKRLKNTIFATYDLVVYGLNRILEYNAYKNNRF